MRIQYFCPRWGSENLAWPAFFDKVAEAGYDGIEWAIPTATKSDEMDIVFGLSAERQMPVIAQHYDTDAANFERHYEDYRQWLNAIRHYPPLKINSQTGKDFFTVGQNCRLIELSHAMMRGTGIPVVHELHRGKWSYAAHVSGAYLRAIPSLRLTFDVSHWVCVSESYLAHQQESVDLAIARTGHVHARVGYPEGPQVPDPRLPEWSEALEHHVRWWDAIAARYRASGEVLTITPEAGPFPYQVYLPGTKEPIASQWDINLWMKQTLQNRYSS